MMQLCAERAWQTQAVVGQDKHKQTDALNWDFVPYQQECTTKHTFLPFSNAVARYWPTTHARLLPSRAAIKNLCSAPKRCRI